jgi:hypothetical protein
MHDPARWQNVAAIVGAGRRPSLFESGSDELDVTVARLDAAVTGVEACPIAPRVAPQFDPARPRQVYVIGHPNGAGLAISIDDNLEVGWREPLLHYRAPTDHGSSGSPVFDDAWRLLAVHHGGSDAMDRLDGAGKYQANEGIWIHTVVDAIARQEAQGSKVESASPAVRPAFRKSIFVSYAHADADWLEKVSVHLKALTRGDSLIVWDDRKIS